MADELPSTANQYIWHLGSCRVFARLAPQLDTPASCGAGFYSNKACCLWSGRSPTALQASCCCWPTTPRSGALPAARRGNHQHVLCTDFALATLPASLHDLHYGRLQQAHTSRCGIPAAN